MDLKKSFEAGKLSIRVVVALFILLPILIVIQLPDIAAYYFLVLFPINAILFGYAGYLAVKNMKLDLIHAGLAGAISAIVSGTIIFILSAVFLLLMTVLGISEGNAPMSNTTFYFSSAIFGIGLGLCLYGPILLVISGIINFIIGVLGGFIAQHALRRNI